MNKRLLPILALPTVALGLAVVPATAASAASATFTASATGANEVSMTGKTGVGAPGASASGTFTADDSTGQFCYTTTASGLSDAVAMHIHKAGAGVSGNIVIPLDAKEIGKGRVCTTASKTLLSDIIANPAGYYYNVHTPAFSAGAVRGQLVAGGPSGVAAGNGGQAAQTGGVPPVGIVLMVVGVGAVGLAGARLVRR